MRTPSIFSILVIILIAVPIIEIGLFIQVGSLIGLWPTLGLIILTAVIGTALLQIQGREALARAKEAIQEHQFPAASVLESIILLICYLLLLTPGFFTDAVGFLLLIPACRRYLMKFIIKSFALSDSSFNSNGSPSLDSSTVQTSSNDKIIEGEFRDL